MGLYIVHSQYCYENGVSEWRKIEIILLILSEL